MTKSSLLGITVRTTTMITRRTMIEITKPTIEMRTMRMTMITIRTKTRTTICITIWAMTSATRMIMKGSMRLGHVMTTRNRFAIKTMRLKV